MFCTLLYYIGLLQLIYALKSAVRMFFQYRCTPLDLPARYGKGSWVLVTGASDGLGAEFCRQFAKHGFNIVLVSRTLAKLESVEKEINTKYPKVQTRMIQMDLAGNCTFDHYRKLLLQTEDLDISVIVPNAGDMKTGTYDKIPE